MCKDIATFTKLHRLDYVQQLIPHNLNLFDNAQIKQYHFYSHLKLKQFILTLYDLHNIDFATVTPLIIQPNQILHSLSIKNQFTRENEIV